MKCYRVWFWDGSAMLVDAEDAHIAFKKAEVLAAKQDFKRSYKSRTAKACDCLSEVEVKL